MSTVPSITLDLADAAELGQLLQFLTDWLAFDRGSLDASLSGFVGHPGYDVEELRADLHRFAFPIGDTDGVVRWLGMSAESFMMSDDEDAARVQPELVAQLAPLLRASKDLDEADVKYLEDVIQATVRRARAVRLERP